MEEMYKKLLDERNLKQGFIGLVGFELTDLGPGYAKGKLELEEKHGNPIGSTHGGLLFTMADTTGGAAATARGTYVTTVSGNINYLNAAMGCKMLYSEAVEVKCGKKIGVYDVTITNEDDLLICKATMTFCRLSKKVPYMEV